MDREPQQDEADDIRERAAEWVILRETEPGAAPELAAWLARDPRHAEAFAKAQRAWGTAADMPKAVPLPANAPARPRPDRRVFGALAAAAVAAAVFGLGWQRPGLWQSLRTDYASLQGQVRSFTLPDGSRMVLGAGSAVDYAEDEAARRVTLLAGAAYFDVVHDGRGFAVHAGQDSVRALGTRFDVRRDGASTAITLEEGSVEVVSPDTAAQRLEPGQQLRLEDRQEPGLSLVDPAQPVDWRQGSFVFYDLPLAEICATLSRHRAGPIAIPGSDLAGRRISGRLRLNQPEAELEALASGLGFRIIRITGTKILL